MHRVKEGFRNILRSQRKTQQKPVKQRKRESEAEKVGEKERERERGGVEVGSSPRDVTWKMNWWSLGEGFG